MIASLPPQIQQVSETSVVTRLVVSKTTIRVILVKVYTGRSDSVLQIVNNLGFDTLRVNCSRFDDSANSRIRLQDDEAITIGRDSQAGVMGSTYELPMCFAATQLHAHVFPDGLDVKRIFWLINYYWCAAVGKSHYEKRRALLTS